MFRPTRITAAIAAIATSLALAAATAGAAPPVERDHARFTDSFSTVVCGIGVDVEVDVLDNFTFYADMTIKSTGTSQLTATNPLNGRTLVVTSAGQFRESAPPLVDEDAGTVTFYPTLKGLQAKYQSDGGSMLMRDAGIIAFADTVDLETGERVARVTTLVNGPHPMADSDFVKTCEVITAALA